MTPIARRYLRQLHLILAVAAALPLLVATSTGAILAAKPWLSPWLYPANHVTSPGGATPIDSTGALARFREQRPDAALRYLHVPRDRQRDPYVIYASAADGRFLTRLLDPFTGELREPIATPLLTTVEALHRHLLAGPVGRYWVAGSGIGLLVIGALGVVLWWPRPGQVPAFGVLAWHNRLGLLALPLVAIMGLTGATLTFHDPTLSLVRGVTGSPALPDAPRVPAVTDPPVSLPDALATARARYPALRVSGFGERDGADAAYELRLRSPTGQHPYGWQRVYLDPRTGETLLAIDYLTHSPASAYEQGWYLWHQGSAFGAPGRTLWAMAALIMAVAMLAGLLSWWRRR